MDHRICSIVFVLGNDSCFLQDVWSVSTITSRFNAITNAPYLFHRLLSVASAETFTRPLPFSTLLCGRFEHQVHRMFSSVPSTEFWTFSPVWGRIFTKSGSVWDWAKQHKMHHLHLRRYQELCKLSTVVAVSITCWVAPFAASTRSLSIC